MLDNQQPNLQPKTRRLLPHPLVFIVAGMIVGVLLLLTLLTQAREAATRPQVQRPTGTGPAVIAVESAMLAEVDGSLPEVGALAPDFAYTMPDGTIARLSDLRGNKVLLNFWATWCAPCRAEMPAIQAALNRHANDGFNVLAVNQSEELARIKLFADELGLTIPLITNVSSDISDAYGARGLPTTYFINRDGTIGFRHIGLMSADFIELRIEEMQ